MITQHPITGIVTDNDAAAITNNFGIFAAAANITNNFGIAANGNSNGYTILSPAIIFNKIIFAGRP